MRGAGRCPRPPVPERPDLAGTPGAPGGRGGDRLDWVPECRRKSRRDFFPLVCNPMDVYFCSFGVVFSYFPSKATIIVAIIVVDFFSL